MCYQNKNEPIVFNGTPIRHRQRLSRAKKVKSTFKHFCFSKAINYFHLFSWSADRQTDGTKRNATAKFKQKNCQFYLMIILRWMLEMMKWNVKGKLWSSQLSINALCHIKSICFCSIRYMKKSKKTSLYVGC